MSKAVFKKKNPKNNNNRKTTPKQTKTHPNQTKPQKTSDTFSLWNNLFELEDWKLRYIWCPQVQEL